MPVYLVQHGLALSKDKDPERGLSQQGIDTTRRIAKVAEGYGIPVAEIRHSGKKRAFQTARIFAKALSPLGGLVETPGLMPMDDPGQWPDKLVPEENTMLVGHLPLLERLCALMITGNAEKPVFRFQNSGIVCLFLHPETGSWAVKWALMPEIP